MNRERLRDAAHDSGKALLLGLAATAVIAVCAFGIGLPVHGFSVLAAFGEVRRWLLIIGALTLFVCAGLLLARGKSESVRKSARWNTQFRVFGLFPVALWAAVVILLAGTAVDEVLFALAA